MTEWKDTSLDDVSKLGGMEPVGAGSLGATIWTPTTGAAVGWDDTSMHDISELGGMEPVGAGSLGGTIWTVTI